MRVRFSPGRVAVAAAAVAGALGARAVARSRRAARQRVESEASSYDEAMRAHDARVARIAAQLRDRRSTSPVSLRKKAVAHQVPKARDLRVRDEKIDISDLTAILHIDVERRVCVAESGVAFVDLVEATLRHGLVPIIVPELKTITIGGAVSGCSIESMSFEHGGFHDTCLEYEVITGTGEVLRCTPDNEHALVYQMVHGSFGTLGILSKLTFKLVAASPFVRVDHERYTTLEDYQRAIARHAAARDLDFMDGIIHSPSLYVLCVGRFVASAPYTSRYDWVTVYWQTTATREVDYFRTPDYFFRYDRGVTNVHPRSWLGRLLLGKVLDSATTLRLAEKLRWAFSDDRPTIILDVFLPFSKVPAFMEWYQREFQHFPLWCVPYRRVRDYEWIADDFYQGMEDHLFLDLAIYGMKQRGDRNYHKLMEDKLRELGGIKTLISHNYYSRDEFWQIWNKANYDRAKAVTDPHNVFRDLYTKTCRVAMGVADGAEE